MHTTAFYDFDLLLKNQNASRSLVHLSSTNNTSSVTASTNNNNTSGTPTQQQILAATTSQLNNNILQNVTTTNTTSVVGLGSGTTQQQQQTATSATAAAALALQQQLNAAVAAQQAQVNHQHQQQQQQNQQKLLLHNALQRAVSHPHNQTTPASVASLVNTLIENFGHRKLERTQSEPLPQVNTSRYKTELCRPFEEAGECKYGDKCQFAHGFHELRNLQRHPKYKTELCRTFHSVGFCPYGPRCHFVHNAEEARLHNRAVNAAYARMAAMSAVQQQQHNAACNPLPLSPPLSMSTGSDRASPTGSLSLSPTNSMANFFANEQNSYPQQQQHQQFAFPHSPPASPIGLSPIASPTPPSTSGSSVGGSSSNSTPPLIDEARLPVFNRLSSTIDAFTNMAI